MVEANKGVEKESKGELIINKLISLRNAVKLLDGFIKKNVEGTVSEEQDDKPEALGYRSVGELLNTVESEIGNSIVSINNAIDRLKKQLLG